MGKNNLSCEPKKLDCKTVGNVKEYVHMDLAEAKNLIHQSPAGFDGHCAHVFRGVCTPQDDNDGRKKWKAAYQTTANIFFTTLFMLGTFGVWIYAPSNLNENEEKKNTPKLPKEHSANKLETVEDIENKMKNSLEEAFKSGITAYAANIYKKEKDPDSEWLLTEFPYLISHKMFSDSYAYMEGVNAPSAYFGVKNSYTGVHVEDGLLASANILLWGAEKLWMFIPKAYRRDVEEALKAHLKREKGFADYRVKEHAVNGNVELEVWHAEWYGCSAPSNHKNIVISPEWLKKLKIPYEMVVQRPGDLVFVGEGVLHQVVNLGPNWCEAVNVGTRDWNKIADHFIPCGCENCQVKSLKANRDVLSGGKIRKIKMHVCKHPDCSNEFHTSQELKHHLASEHNKSKPKEICQDCGKIFDRLALLRDHQRRACHKKSEPCSKCGKPVSKGHENRHKETCGLNYDCPICKEPCTNSQGLASHMKSKHEREDISTSSTRDEPPTDASSRERSKATKRSIIKSSRSSFSPARVSNTLANGTSEEPPLSPVRKRQATTSNRFTRGSSISQLLLSTSSRSEVMDDSVSSTRGETPTLTSPRQLTTVCQLPKAKSSLSRPPPSSSSPSRFSIRRLDCLKATINNNVTQYESKVEALTDALGYVTKMVNNWPQQREQQSALESLVEWANEQTLRLILHSDWSEIATERKIRLKDNLDRCNQELTEKCNALADDCRKIIRLMENPWDKPALKNLDEKTTNNNEAELIQIFHEEGFEIIKMRLTVLVEEDHREVAVKLTAAFIRSLNQGSLSCELSDPNKVTHMMDAHLVLLYELKRNKEIANHLRLMKVEDSLKVIERLGDKKLKKNGLLWQSSHESASMIANCLVINTMVMPFDQMDSDALMRVFSCWASLQYPTDQDLPEVIRKLIEPVSSARHMFIFCKTLMKHFGDSLKPLVIEMYTRAITTGINEWEELKADAMKKRITMAEQIVIEKKVQETTRQLSQQYLDLADYIKEVKVVARECVLTAHSIHPSEACYSRIEEIRRITEETYDDYQFKSRDYQHQLGITSEMFDDLHTLMTSNRHPKMSSLSNWTTMDDVCRTLLQNT